LEKLTDDPSSNAWQVQPGSALAGDDAKTNPYQLSHAAWHALTVAVDHLRCLRNSLVDELEGNRLSVRICTHAQSSLVRGAIENGARAVWLLGPRTRLTRVQRRLSLEAMEVNHSYQLHTLMKASAPRTKGERIKQLRDLAIAAGVPRPEVKKALASPQYRDIVREAGQHTALGADITGVIWSGCSALSHGALWGTLGMLEKEIVARDMGVAYARVTGSIGLLYWTTAGAVRTIEYAFHLYGQRAARHI